MRVMSFSSPKTFGMLAFSTARKPSWVLNMQTHKSFHLQASEFSSDDCRRTQDPFSQIPKNSWTIWEIHLFAFSVEIDQ